jgi:serine protease Do
MRNLKMGLAAVAAFSLLSAAAADVPRVKDVESRPALAFPAGATARPLTLQTVRTRFETPTTRIGEIQSGLFCSNHGPITWNAKLYGLFSGQFSRTFRAELESAGYPVPVQTDAIFTTPADRERQRSSGLLYVGALIKNEAANFCVTDNETTGGVYLQVFWQVLQVDTQKVIFQTTTEGSYQSASREKVAPPSFFLRAFAAASRNLLADDGFQKAVLAVPAAVAAQDSASRTEVLKLTGAKPSAETLNKHVTMLRAAVATVSNGSGSGTAFFISNGYLLTNAHVTGDAKIVKVTLPTGRELVGEVIRSNRARDMALIKTEPSGVPPLPLRSGEANIGDEVYAVGSPLGDQFNSTLTRGIVSGYRTLGDNRYIQSDVAILPGNSGGPLLDAQGSVIGVTVMGLGAKGLAGMNFFIPIEDALAKLGVEVE